VIGGRVECGVEKDRSLWFILTGFVWFEKSKKCEKEIIRLKCIFLTISNFYPTLYEIMWCNFCFSINFDIHYWAKKNKLTFKISLNNFPPFKMITILVSIFRFREYFLFILVLTNSYYFIEDLSTFKNYQFLPNFNQISCKKKFNHKTNKKLKHYCEFY
jgi:hypothetical protein